MCLKVYVSCDHGFVKRVSIASCYDRFMLLCVGKRCVRISWTLEIDPGGSKAWRFCIELNLSAVPRRYVRLGECICKVRIWISYIVSCTVELNLERHVQPGKFVFVYSIEF